jgi:hypothetical protein
MQFAPFSELHVTETRTIFCSKCVGTGLTGLSIYIMFVEVASEEVYTNAASGCFEPPRELYNCDHWR